MSLYLDLGPEDRLESDGPVKLTVVRKSGSRVRLRIDGDALVQHFRKGQAAPDRRRQPHREEAVS